MNPRPTVPAPWSTTGLGSLPFAEPAEAVAHVFAHYDIPFWPQLPKCGPGEHMLRQFLTPQGRAILAGSDEAGGRFDSAASGWPAADQAAAWTPFIKHLEALPAEKRPAWVKGQVTGPYSLEVLLQMSPEFADAEGEAPRAATSREGNMSRWARWVAAIIGQQVRRLQALGPRVQVWLDEPCAGLPQAAGETLPPGLAAAAEEIRRIPGTVGPGHSGGDGGEFWMGLHLCAGDHFRIAEQSGPQGADAIARTLLWATTTGVRVAGVEVWASAAPFAKSGPALARHLKDGGWIAWGAVSTLGHPPPAAVLEALRHPASWLGDDEAARRLSQQSMLTAACGTGLRSIEDEMRVVGGLKSLQAALR